MTETKDRLVIAAQELFIYKGYAETSVDQICAAVGATKGAFFHHFESKEAIGREALASFAHARMTAMRQGEEDWPEDPVDRALGFVDHAIRLSTGRKAPKGCLLALLAMELGAANAGFRQDCAHYFQQWTAYLEQLLAAALAERPPVHPATAGELASYFVAVFEGSMVLARATGDLGVFARHLGSYRQHLELIFGRSGSRVPRLERRRSSKARPASKQRRSAS